MFCIKFLKTVIIFYPNQQPGLKLQNSCPGFWLTAVLWFLKCLSKILTPIRIRLLQIVAMYHLANFIIIQKLIITEIEGFKVRIFNYIFFSKLNCFDMSLRILAGVGFEELETIIRHQQVRFYRTVNEILSFVKRQQSETATLATSSRHVFKFYPFAFSTKTLSLKELPNNELHIE